MFIGHFAVALGAKRAAPAVSLGLLFLACQLADILWPTLLLLGVERVEIDPGNTAMTPLRFVSYPYSHSLMALLAWSVLIAALYRVVGRSRTSAAVVVGLVAVSHWVLDAVTHRPDVPLTFTGSTRIGLGLWNSVPATIAVEAAMLIAGLSFYVGATRPVDRIGSIGFWSLLGVLTLIYVASILGPPPPSSSAVAWTAQGLWLFVLWAFWADGHRRAVGAPD